MVVFPRFGYEPGSSVLYSLEFGKEEKYKMIF